MTQRTITAMYDSSSQAEAARDQLVGIGVPSSDINIRGTSGGASSGGTTMADDNRSFWDDLKDLFVPDEDRHTYAEGMRRGGSLLTANVPAGLEDQAIDVLEASGAVDLDTRSGEWRESGWQGYEGVAPTARGATYDTGAVAATGLAEDSGQRGSAFAASADVGTRETTTTARGEGVVEAAEERLRVGKREVERGGVRVRSYVREIPVEEQVALREETVRVERRPVDREVAAGDDAFREKEIEAVERDEEAVVAKEARVTEEIAIGKDVDTRTETVRDTVRKQEVEVEDARTADRDLDTTRRDGTTRAAE
jgi:uncharacterized protein (TIGR02271 family)